MFSDLSQCQWELLGTDASDQPVRVPVTLPGDNATALYAAGIIPDPYAGRNESAVQFIGDRKWLFRTEFTLDALPENPVYLNLDSADTCAEIRLNGTVLGQSDNMFARFRAWTGHLLKAGKNTLEIEFESVTAEANRRAGRSRESLGQNDNNAIPNLQFLRKIQSSGGWDWGICLPVCGLYDSLYLAEAPARIEHLTVSQSFKGPDAVLTVQIEFNACKETTLPLTLRFAEQTQSRTLELPAGKSAQEFSFSVSSPALWNPAGYGGQNLYSLEAATPYETKSRRIGFRKLELVREKDGENAESFYFKINGNDIFCKGANWIPADAMPGRTSPDKIRSLLQSARDANMNMIRVWGGGRYESDLFYDICDELGLLVWQDCMFACVRYPSDPEFLKSVDRELEFQVKRLSVHPCMALWCGDNEICMCHGHTPDSEEQYRNALQYHFFNQALMRILKKYNTDIPVWNSSPCKGPEDMGANVWNPSRGDLHYWDVWHGDKPFEAFYSVAPRFCAEFGFQSFPLLSTLRRWISPEHRNLSAPEMEAHQKNGIGNTRILSTFARYFRVPVGFEQTVYLSQVQQALAMQTGVDHFRSLQPYCMGALYWQLNDNWPVASWSSIDYTGGWKILHYAAKRFFAPLRLTAVKRDGVFTVCLVNDTPGSIPGTLHLLFHSFRGKTENLLAEKLEIAGQSVVFPVQIPDCSDPENGFFELRFETGTQVLRNEFFPVAYKRSALPVPKIRTQIRKTASGFEVALSAGQFAFFVFAELRDTACRWSDNAVTLYPGEEVVLLAHPETELSEEEFRKQLVVHDLGSTANPEIQ